MTRPNQTAKADLEPDALDARIRQAVASGDRDRAATLFMQRYGGEILAFVAGRLRDETDSADVFSAFSEDFWRGLPGFGWRCSLRSWAYTLARNAIHRYRKSPANSPHRNVRLSEHREYAEEVARLRSATRQYLRTEVKSRMRELREQLPEDDQILLILRIDKELPWNELAVVLSGEGDGMDPQECSRWSARLRQRFKTVKDRLRELARADGLLG